MKNQHTAVGQLPSPKYPQNRLQYFCMLQKLLLSIVSAEQNCFEILLLRWLPIKAYQLALEFLRFTHLIIYLNLVKAELEDRKAIES